MLHSNGENTSLHLRQDFEVSNTLLCSTQLLIKEKMQVVKRFQRTVTFGLGALLQNQPPKL